MTNRDNIILAIETTATQLGITKEKACLTFLEQIMDKDCDWIDSDSGDTVAPDTPNAEPDDNAYRTWHYYQTNGNYDEFISDAVDVIVQNYEDTA